MLAPRSGQPPEFGRHGPPLLGPPPHGGVPAGGGLDSTGLDCGTRPAVIPSNAIARGKGGGGPRFPHATPSWKTVAGLFGTPHLLLAGHGPPGARGGDPPTGLLAAVWTRTLAHCFGDGRRLADAVYELRAKTNATHREELRRVLV